ncbi:MAG: FAD-dependent oxidoreductase [bacterium]
MCVLSATDAAAADVVSSHETSCVIVGGGPAGLVLALLLARRGVSVTLLEAHADFDRDFRGDTLHPGILEMLDQLGLAEGVHELPHVKWYGPSLVTRRGVVPLMDFSRLATRFPYIMVMPQHQFLGFLAAELAQYPHFRLLMRARVQELVVEDGIVRGVRYHEGNGDAWHEVRASLTVGADGRFSRVRQLADIEAVVVSDPMELLWFRLPRLDDDAEHFDSVSALVREKPLAVLNGERGSAVGFVNRGDGFLLAMFNRIDHWQVAYIYPAGTYQQLKAAGLDAFRQSIVDLEPRLVRHVASLTNWRDLAPLSVAFSRCRKWYKPGLLLIGDAAHVMTPAAGAGIKYAIEDAVETANVAAGPLLAGSLVVEDLARVQRRREWPTRVIQRVASFQQRTVLARALRAGKRAELPAGPPLLARILLKIPLLRDLPAYFIAFGVRRVRVEDTSDVALRR